MKWEDLLALIGNVGARPGWTPVEETRWNQTSEALGASARSDGSGPNPTAQNPPLYYAWDAIPYRASLFTELPTRLLVMRLWNIPLYLAIVVFAWLAAGEVFRRRRWLQTITAGTVAMLPELGFIAGMINPDVLLAALWAALIYTALVLVRVGPRPKVLLAFAGVVAGIALTHGRGLSALGPLVVVLAVVGWRARPLARRTVAWLAATLGIAGVGFAMAVAYSQHFGGGSSIGDEAGATAGAGSFKGFVTYLWEFYFPPLKSMAPQVVHYGYGQAFIEGLGGTFASLEVAFPPLVYDLLKVAAAVGLILLALSIARHWDRIARHPAQAIVLASFGVSILALLHGAAYRNLESPPFDPLIVGRYLLPMALLGGLAIAFVCAALPRRVGALLGAAVLVAFTVLSIAGIGLTVGRFYA